VLAVERASICETCGYAAAEAVRGLVETVLDPVDSLGVLADSFCVWTYLPGVVLVRVAGEVFVLF